MRDYVKSFLTFYSSIIDKVSESNTRADYDVRQLLAIRSRVG